MKCPRSGCESAKVVKAGFTLPLTSLADKRRQRYLCRGCGKRFNENYHSFNFGLRKADSALNAKIFQLCLHNLSGRAIGRWHSISEHCVRIRLARMARAALVFHDRMLQGAVIREEICFDGLENFSISQYDPNNINQAIGRDSLFIYDFNFAPLNRKGRMSPWQRRRLAEIEAKEGRYDPKAIRLATCDILERLSHKRCPAKKTFTLLSDEHFQYRRVIGVDLRSHEIEHVTVSSQACRNFQNILFSVNHADLVIRQQVKAFSRETISFNKTAGAMCQRYALFLVHKNYMSPQFTKTHVKRPKAHVQSPAEALGLTTERTSFGEIFSRRLQESDFLGLNADWQCFQRGEVPAKYHRHPQFVRKSLAAAA